MPRSRPARPDRPLHPARLAGLLCLCLLTAGCGVPGLGPDPGPPPLRVEGNLLTVYGEREVLAGASLYVMPFYTASDGGPDPALAATTERVYRDREAVLDRMRDVGVDTVRIPVARAGYERDVYGLGGREGYLDRLREVVGAAAERDLRVIVGWWDSHSTGRAWLDSYREVLPMMGEVRAALEPWPGVLYEPFNEPHEVSWQEWEQVMSDVVRYWREDLGHEGVLVLDTVDYSWSFSPGPARRLQRLDAGLREGAPQLVFANHRYANDAGCFCDEEQQEWVDEVGQHVDEFPVLGTEYGNWTGPDFTPDPRWNEQFAEHVVQRAVPDGMNGYVAFVWDWVDENSMTTDEGRTLRPWGQRVQDSVLDPLAPGGAS